MRSLLDDRRRRERELTAAARDGGLTGLLLIRLGHRPPTDADLRIMRRAALMVGTRAAPRGPAAVPEPRFGRAPTTPWIEAWRRRLVAMAAAVFDGNDGQSPNGAPAAEARDASSTERPTVSETGT
jgi:hypothetical protein